MAAAAASALLQKKKKRERGRKKKKKKHECVEWKILYGRWGGRAVIGGELLTA